jgi:hypothetical protein
MLLEHAGKEFVNQPRKLLIFLIAQNLQSLLPHFPVAAEKLFTFIQHQFRI